jgi:rRNA processing protein Gar1
MYKNNQSTINKVLNLDNREETEKEMRNYLELECPHYLGSKPDSIELVQDVSIKLFEGTKRSRVLVYDVKLQNNSEAFGTLGGILYPLHSPYLNVFPKEKIKEANIAASMHLYFEASNRYKNGFFGKKENLDELAEMLEIPQELRKV